MTDKERDPLGEDTGENNRDPLSGCASENTRDPLGDLPNEDARDPLDGLLDEDSRDPLGDIADEDIHDPLGGLAGKDAHPLGGLTEEDARDPLGGVVSNDARDPIGDCAAQKDEESIGYRKPPRRHTWKPGQSGNPRGSRRETDDDRNLYDVVNDLLDGRNKLKNGKTLSGEDLIAEQIMTTASNGDPRAFREFIRLCRRAKFFERIAVGPRLPRACVR